MREIKFRAWANGKMFDDVDLLEGHVVPRNWHEDKYAFHPSDAAFKADVIMQFTGLQDKNGTDIYEGDIVKSLVNMIFSQGTHNREVIFKDCCFYCGPTSLDNIVNSFKAEVIGNIHENPELLESVE